VGKTTRTVEARWRQHRTEARIGRYDWPLYRDMRQFGFDVFEVVCLGEADCQRRLNQMERKFIREFNTVENGYNLMLGSAGGRPKLRRARNSNHLPEHHRAKIAESVRLAWQERKAALAC
jgi:hypothetical protein